LRAWSTTSNDAQGGFDDMTHELDPDADLPPHLTQLFLRIAPGHLALVVDACAKRDVEAARLAAHKLKGSLYAAGASALAEDVEGLRATLAKGNFALVPRPLQAICDDFSVVVSELERRLRGNGS
jgi:hypothetical protein